MNIEKFKEMLKMRNLSFGKTKDGEPILTPSRTNPEITYMHIYNFLELLDEKNLDIDVQTMKIHDKIVEQKTPATPVQEGPATEVKTIDDAAKEKTEGKPQPEPETPPKVEIEAWTENELRAIKLKEDLIKIAAIDPIVNTKGTKEELIIKLIGRPKSFE